KQAKSVLTIIDPYLDENVLTEFAVLASEGVVVRLLTDEATAKPGLFPAHEKWRVQYGPMRPVELRLAPPKSLHDRAIDVDGSDIWILTQSFNALAARAPATIARAPAEVRDVKIPFYQQAWQGAKRVS